jgi:xylitol oxidase
MIDSEKREPLSNWSGNLNYGTSRLYQADSVEEIKAWIVKHHRFKVLGTRHCFNDIADSQDVFLSLARSNKIMALDTSDLTVTVEAGIRYGELAAFLHDHGFALHNLASLPHISVAGGCATATHGSGVHNGNLSSAVIGMEFITPAGETVDLSRQRDGDRFCGAVVHLGGIGVITQLTLAIEPAYQVKQYVYEDLAMTQLERHFDEIMSAGYSVSLFTDWRDKNINSVWVKVRVGEELFGAKPDFFGARAATRDLHPIPGISAEHCTTQLGVPGPWHERLPHFKMGFTPSSGDELQTEYFVPRVYSFAAIEAIAALHAEVSPHLLISELRCVAADDAWMSPCADGPFTAIHFTWKPEWAAVKKLLPRIEEALASFRAKPHWGKLFTMPHSRLAQLYPKMDDFRQLMQHFDPGGKLRNAYLDRLLFGR